MQTNPPNDLLDFIPRISPRFTQPTHLAPLIERLERIPETPQFLIVSVPPRHSKSETLLHFMALLLSRFSHMRIAYSSYAQTFSETQAIKAHRYAKASGVQPNPLMANRKDWQTNEGGGIFATGVGGEFTGRGADLLVIDDPVANRDQANSPTYRNKVWAWFEDVAETRLEPGASCVLLMTRWHADDLAGRLIANRSEYEVIRLPALADGLDPLGKNQAADPLGREVDAPLWPARYDFEALDKIRKDKPYTFASLYQGLPRPREGTLLSEPTFYSELPSSYRVRIGVDLAYSAKARADASAAVVYFVADDIWYVRHVETWRSTISESVARLQRLQQTYGSATIGVEANGPQKAVADLLEEKHLKIDRVQRVTDKLSEAQNFAEAWASGRIRVPDTQYLSAPWLSAYLDELLEITGVSDAHDDQLDASVNGFKEALRPMRPSASFSFSTL